MPERARPRVRLSDVAARAGVSVGSASQAFSRPELVSEKVRTQVLEAAAALGYSGPDPAARRLTSGKSSIPCVVDAPLTCMDVVIGTRRRESVVDGLINE